MAPGALLILVGLLIWLTLNTVLGLILLILGVVILILSFSTPRRGWYW